MLPRNSYICSAVVLGLLPVGRALAQIIDTGGIEKSFEIVRASAVINVDGILDEEVWNRVTVIDDLHQVEPLEYSEPTQRTEIRIFYDDEGLYVGARLWDTEADSITANVLRQGEGLGAEDRFTVILDPYLDRRSGYRFELNSNGVRWDALYQDTTRLESNWEGIWQGAATRDDAGWTAEIRIPFKTLSFNPNTADWGINFERAIQRVGETIGWVSRNRQLNPGVAGTASGFEELQQGRGLDIVPSVSMRRAQIYGASGGRSSDTEPSLDVFYKVTPSLNAGQPNPLSAISIQSLADMGYSVDVTQAEPYSKAFTSPARAPASGARMIDLSNDVIRRPIGVVDERGRVIRVIIR